LEEYIAFSVVGTNTKEKEELWFVITKNKENWSCKYSEIPQHIIWKKYHKCNFVS
jgi:hypothetical protein